MSKPRGLSALVAGVIVALTVVLPGAATAGAGSGVVQSPPVDESGQEPWTQERMDSARPLDNGIAVGGAPQTDTGGATGKPGAAGGTSSNAKPGGGVPRPPTSDTGPRPASGAQGAPSSGSGAQGAPSSRSAQGTRPSASDGPDSANAPASGSGGTAADGTPEPAASQGLQPSAGIQNASSQSDASGPVSPQAWVVLGGALLAAAAVVLRSRLRRHST